LIDIIMSILTGMALFVGAVGCAILLILSVYFIFIVLGKWGVYTLIVIVFLWICFLVGQA